MGTKEVGGAILAATLTAEAFLKHEEGYPHTHIDLEYPTHNSRIGVRVYGIPYNQFAGSVNVPELAFSHTSCIILKL